MVQHEIIGDDMQAVILTLAAGDEVRAEAGAMMFMTDTIEMDAKMEGGFLGGLKRKFLAGESFFITYFRSPQGSGRVAFAGPYPGKIIQIDLASSQILCQKDSFLCAVGAIDLSIAFTKRIGAGFFGGEGFILQKMEGTGKLFIHSGGTIVPMTLGAGERLKVDTGCLVAPDPDDVVVDRGVEGSRRRSSVGKGCSSPRSPDRGGCGSRPCRSPGWPIASIPPTKGTAKTSSGTSAV